MPSLAALLAEKRVLLADGATGTNYFEMGLTAGDPPEMWTTDHPERVAKLHQDFVDAGADVILTNTFGCNRHRLKLHKLQDQSFDLNKRAAEIAREVADKAGRPVIVAGSVGPTGELFEPLGQLTHAAALAGFKEQIEGLKAVLKEYRRRNIRIFSFFEPGGYTEQADAETVFRKIAKVTNGVFQEYREGVYLDELMVAVAAYAAQGKEGLERLVAENSRAALTIQRELLRIEGNTEG